MAPCVGVVALKALATQLDAASSKEALVKLLKARARRLLPACWALTPSRQSCCEALAAVEQQETLAFPELETALSQRRLLRHKDPVRRRGAASRAARR